jgi:hypothetical protein
MSLLDQTSIVILGFAILLAILVTIDAVMERREKAELKQLMKRNLAYKNWWKNDKY